MTLARSRSLDTVHARRRAALVAATLVAQAAIGLAVSRLSPTLVLGGVAALTAGALMVWWPALAGWALILFTSTVATSEYTPRLELSSGGGIFITELIVAIYVAYRAFRLFIVRDRAYRLGWPEALLALFFAQVALSSYLAITTGRVAPSAVRAFARGYLLYAAFFVFIGTLRDLVSFRRFLVALQVVTAITAVMIIIQAIIGRDRPIFFGNPLEYIQGTLGSGDFPRVRPPAFYLIYTLFLPAVALFLDARGRARLWYAVLLLLYLAAILISLQRIVWIALAVGLMVYAAVSSARIRARVFGVGGVVLILGVVATVIVAWLVPTFTDTAIGRVAVLGTGRDDSVLGKLNELRLASRLIAEAPVFGNGAGVDYGLVSGSISGNTYVLASQRYTHNSYVNLLLFFGALGLALFLGFAGTAVAAGLRALRRGADPANRNLVAGLIAASVVLFVAAIAMGTLGTAAAIVPMALVLAGLVTAERSSRARVPPERPATGPPPSVARSAR